MLDSKFLVSKIFRTNSRLYFDSQISFITRMTLDCQVSTVSKKQTRIVLLNLFNKSLKKTVPFQQARVITY